MPFNEEGYAVWTREMLARCFALCLGPDVFLSYNQWIIVYFHSQHRQIWGLETLDYLWKCLLRTSFTQQTFLAFSIRLRRC